MKNFIFMLFAFAMCVSTAAIADDRVTATSELEMVCEIGVADLSVVANSETAFINYMVAESGGYTYACGVSVPAPAIAMNAVDDVGLRHGTNDTSYFDGESLGNRLHAEHSKAMTPRKLPDLKWRKSYLVPITIGEINTEARSSIPVFARSNLSC